MEEKDRKEGRERNTETLMNYIDASLSAYIIRVLVKGIFLKTSKDIIQSFLNDGRVKS